MKYCDFYLSKCLTWKFLTFLSNMSSIKTFLNRQKLYQKKISRCQYQFRYVIQFQAFTELTHIDVGYRKYFKMFADYDSIFLCFYANLKQLSQINVNS